MNYSQLANPRILEQPVYQPGKPIEVVAHEQGFEPDQVCKLASNENPWGASPAALQAAKDALEDVHRYPDGSGTKLIEQLADLHSLKSSQFILGNGSNEIIELIGHVFLSPKDEVIYGEHSFVVYKLVALLMGAKPVSSPMPELRHDLDRMREKVTTNTKLIFLPSPNNPTGSWNSEEEIFTFVRSLPEHVIFCFDEAYAEYLNNPPNLKILLEEGRKVVALRTFSKIYGLAGLRIGYAYGSEEVIRLLQLARQPFNANSIAMCSAIAALKDQPWVEACRERNNLGLRQLENACDEMGLKWVPSKANFLLIQIGDGMQAFDALQKTGIIARPMHGTLKDYIRISVGTKQENDRVIEALKRIQSGFEIS